MCLYCALGEILIAQVSYSASFFYIIFRTRNYAIVYKSADRLSIAYSGQINIIINIIINIVKGYNFLNTFLSAMKYIKRLITINGIPWIQKLQEIYCFC